MIRIVMACAAILALAGCATEKMLEATGGSRADGTVKLSFEYGLFEQPVVHWDQALSTATDRCHAWGYSGAEKFGGALSQCEASDAYGSCVRTLVTVSYQCTGRPG